jgi:L-fucose mutarotase
MLKNLSPLLNGPLLQILADMGHGDRLAIVDANFPSASCAKRLVRLDGVSATDVLQAILTLFPIDDFVPNPVGVMGPSSGEAAPMLDSFAPIVMAGEGRDITLETIERFAFYDQARAAYAIVATTERRPYGCIILAKGVVR